MRRFPSAPCLYSVVRTLAATAILTVAASPAFAQGVTVGPNVNMGGGPAIFTPPSTIVGDPFLQRQNEPSLAVSSRNPCHLLAGANDYRMVDVEEDAGEVGDAWLGVFKSFDCGATWTSTLLPGHKLDTSASGLASPLKGLAAAADATVRAGTSGLFYYSGIAFNRGDGGIGKVFVSRFIDNNNNDGGDPIEYLGATQIDLGTSGQFLDKPWIVADVPRDGSTCSINGRTVPAGPVYLVYTSFVGGDNNVHSKIMFSKSSDCGATWSNPSKLSERVAKNQGTTIAIDPGTGDIHIAWREFSATDDANSRNAILVARSSDGGRTFTKAEAITPQFVPFDQASSPLTFRTTAYPTLAVVPAEADARAAGQPGRVYVAWSARGFAVPRGNQTAGDARIVMSSSIGGVTWSTPQPTDIYEGAGHQIMPALAFAGGKIALAYYDLRDDAATDFDDLVIEYGQQAFDQCVANNGGAGFAAVYMCILDIAASDKLSRRHTLDMRAAMADARGLASFSSSSVLGSQRVSRYIEGSVRSDRRQLQYNRPNLPIFSRGRYPFIGDYIDIAGQSFVATEGGWEWNTGQLNRPAPVFHVAWADNRNVGTPSAGSTPDWSLFTPPVTGPNSVVCVAGQVGIRNQDVYTAQLRPGLIVSAPQNSKRIAGLQRSFVVVAHNTTDYPHVYEFTAAPPSNVIASFNQFSGFGIGDPLDTVRVTIPRKSSASRTLFVALTNPTQNPDAAPDVLVPVQVDQLPDAVSDFEDFDTVYLNPDFENPDFENPDFENTELHNPDFENPDFENPDFENPDFENPDFENPDFENFTLGTNAPIRNPDFENPDFENPDFENPDFENPDFENPDFENPDFENPDFENPDFENPDFENPDFENPDFENPDFENGAFVADTSWPVQNGGNTTSAFKTNVFVKDSPDGVRYQLTVRRIYSSPASVCSADGTTSRLSARSVPLVNIVSPGPNVTSPDILNRDFNSDDYDNATFSLAPGEFGIVTLRAYCAVGTSCTPELLATLQRRTALGVVAQAANCYSGPIDLGDQVGGFSRCEISEGTPKDLYDPIPPELSLLPPAAPGADDDNIGDPYGEEPVSFTLVAVDNLAIDSVSCTGVGAAVKSGNNYQFSGIFALGTTTVLCTATDLRGNPASISFDVEVRDVTPPAFDMAADPGSPFLPSGNPAEATSADGAQVFYSTPTATDSNGGPVDVTCGSGGGLVSGSVFPIGTTDINCVATDVSGVSTAPTNLFDIAVADRTAPLFGPLANIIAEATSAAGAVVSYASPTATDAVDANVAISCVQSSGSVFPIGTSTVNCTATDDANNVADAAFTVTVSDGTAPVFGGVANVIAEATSAAGATVTYTSPSATDVVDASVTISCVQPSGSVFPMGTSTVNCTATDDANNVANSAFTVTVGDGTAPVFLAVTNAIAEATSAAGAAVTYAVPSATDAVGATVSCVPAAGSTFTLGTSTVTCTATDAAGNSATTTLTVTVRDTVAPTLTVPANISGVIATSAAGAIVSYTASATDLVDATPTVACTPASGATFAVGTTTVTCTATDDALNASAAKTFTVTVIDLPPSVTAAANPPTLLWSPNKTMTPVTVSGKITVTSLKSASYKVVDEYGKVQPAGTVIVGANGSYSFVVKLEAYRNGNDSNGRVYTITVTAVDTSNRSASAQAIVTVPHNQ